MRVLVQWARAVGRDWEEIASAQWRHAPNRPDPTGLGLAPDDTPGWVNALNVQGIVFEGADHYAVEHLDDETVRVTAWYDSPQDHAPRWRHGYVWTIKTLAPDARGFWNTRQTCVRYAEDEIAIRLRQRKWFDVQPFDQLPVPPAETVRHGKTISNAGFSQHMQVRGVPGWREWTEGVPGHLVTNGKLKQGAR
jgi:hypothetical protein